MFELDPQRVAELPPRLDARALREEDFEILPALRASSRQLAPWVSEEGLTDERLQALIWGAR
jgi:hypothetical protein